MTKRHTVSGGKLKAHSTRTPGPPRLKPKQRAFVDEYLECGNATEAQRRVYGVKSSNNLTQRRNAQSKLRRPQVAAYLAERQAELRERHSVTIDSVNAEINEALSIARDDRNPAAMISALTLRARLHGLLTDKQKVEQSGELTIKWANADDHDPVQS